MREIIVDLFAGGGGVSTGIEIAIGDFVDVAVNHDPAAVSMHKANHPYTTHYLESIYDVNPVAVCMGRPVGWLHASPDCKHFSIAKGGQPRDQNIRGLAWELVRWAKAVKPRIVSLENVKEFQDWGPLDEEGKPIKERKGETFREFVAAMEALGYVAEWQVLNSADYGARTQRHRLVMLFRIDGQPIVWPEQTHAERNSEAVKSGQLPPWRAVAEVLDWARPCPSIFERKKPLRPKTMRRIARGLNKFVLKEADPFLVVVNHGGKDFRGQPLTDPLATITSKNGTGLVVPVITKFQQNSIGSSPVEPVDTIMAGATRFGLAAPYLTQYHGETSAHEVRGQQVDEPLQTIDTNNRYGMVMPSIQKFYGTNVGQSAQDPLHTITASGGHFGLLSAFLSKYYGQGTGQPVTEPIDTITTKDRFAAVQVHIEKLPQGYGADLGHWPEVRQLLNEHLDMGIPEDGILLLRIFGEDWFIAGIGLRMLEPRELYDAQGFLPDYRIEYDDLGEKITRKDQVAKVGNSVPPALITAVVRANWPERCVDVHFETMAQLRAYAEARYREPLASELAQVVQPPASLFEMAGKRGAAI